MNVQAISSLSYSTLGFPIQGMLIDAADILLNFDQGHIAYSHMSLRLKRNGLYIANFAFEFWRHFRQKFAIFKQKNRETSFVLKSKEKRKKIIFENVESPK